MYRDFVPFCLDVPSLRHAIFEDMHALIMLILLVARVPVAFFLKADG